MADIQHALSAEVDVNNSNAANEQEFPPALPNRPSAKVLRLAFGDSEKSELEETIEGKVCDPDVHVINEQNLNTDTAQQEEYESDEEFIVRNLDTGERYHAVDHEDSLNKLLESLTVTPEPVSVSNKNNINDNKNASTLKRRAFTKRVASLHPAHHLRIKLRKATNSVSKSRRDRFFRKRRSASDATQKSTASSVSNDSISTKCIKPDPAPTSSKLVKDSSAKDAAQAQILAPQHRIVQSLTGTANDDRHAGLPIRALQFSVDGCLLASAGDSGRIIVWERLDGSIDDDDECDGARLHPKPLCEFEGHSGPITCLAWSRGHFFASGSTDGLLRLWHVSRLDSLCEFRHPEPVTQVAFHPYHETKLLTASSDGILRVWNAKKGRVVRWVRTPAQVASACFSPDGLLVAVGLVDGTCVLYRFANLEFYGLLECRNRRGVHREGRAVVGLTCIPRPNYAELEKLRRRRKLEGNSVNHIPLMNKNKNKRSAGNAGKKVGNGDIVESTELEVDRREINNNRKSDGNNNSDNINDNDDNNDNNNDKIDNENNNKSDGSSDNINNDSYSANNNDNMSNDKNNNNNINNNNNNNNSNNHDNDANADFEPGREQVDRTSWKSQTGGWLLVATTHDSRIRLLDPVSFTCVAKCKGLASNELPVAASVSSNGTMICCGTSNGRVCIWDLENRNETSASSAYSSSSSGTGGKRFHARRSSFGTGALRMPTGKRKQSFGDLGRDSGTLGGTGLVEKSTEWCSFQANNFGAVTACSYVPISNLFSPTFLPPMVVGGVDGTISWFEANESRLSM